MGGPHIQKDSLEKTMKSQATKANRAQVEQHIRRQRDLGECMIGGPDRVRFPELWITGCALAGLIISAWMRGWFS